MSSVTVAILFLLAIWAFYIGFLVLTDFFAKFAPYINIMVVNYFWFSASQTVYSRHIFYPELFTNGWINFALTSSALLFITYLLTRVKEVKASLLITSGTLCMLISFGVIFEKVMIGNFPGAVSVSADELPGWVEPVFIGCGVMAVVVALVIVSRRRDYDEPGKFYSRFFACLILAPAPFSLIAALLLRMNASTELTHKQWLFSLIVMFTVILVYYILDTWSDNRRIRIAQENDMREVRKAQMRSEISNGVRKQMDKIDNCMVFLRNNIQFMKENQKSRSLAIYREAKQIERAYHGTADGDVLKRLTEIKDELEVIRAALNEELRKASNRAKAQNQSENSNGSADKPSAGSNGSGRQNSGSSDSNREAEKGQVQEQSVISAFFNGCANDDEIRKRYHQLCKVFHPDSGNGDEETFVLIKEEYDRLLHK